MPRNRKPPSQPSKQLLERIAELEAELGEREKDLATFRKQIAATNQRLERMIHRVEEEIRLARALQKRLVPTEFPNIPGFEFSTRFIPSEISGGDYFDIFELEDRMRFAITVASSSGYGMSALLLSVLLKNAGQIETRRGSEPAHVVQTIQQELASIANPKDRAHLFYGIVNRRTLEFTYVCAGRVAALRRSAHDGTFTVLGPSSHALGNADAVEIRQGQVNLEARDQVILVTPGLLSLTRDGEFFGEERLFQSLIGLGKIRGPISIHDLRNELLFQAEEFTGGTAWPLDVTVVAIEVKENVIRLAPNVDDG